VAMLRRMREVSRMREHGNELELALADGADPNTLLQHLVSNGVRLRRFEITEPSLEQIFIERVGADSEAAAQEPVDV
jgi:ABC-2 type transport system ATP-binding protein